MCRVILLYISEDPDVIILDEVDRNTLPAESSRSSDPVDVELTIVWEVIVDDQGHLLDINATGPDISCDEDTRLSTPELLHNRVPLFLWHVAMHRAHGKVSLPHLLGEPVHLALGVAEDDGLGDGQGVVQVTESVELPLLPLNSHEELLDALKGQLVTFNQDPDGVGHELGGHLEDLVGKGGGDETDLSGWGQIAIHVIDLLLESLIQHLVGLVQHQHLDAPGPQSPPPNHVKYPPRGSRHHVLPVIKLPDVLSEIGSSDAGVTLDVHVVSKSQHDLLDLDGQLPGGRQTENLGLPHSGVNTLEDGAGEGRGLSCSGLSLSDDITTLHDGLDCSLLDGGGLLESVGVNSSE